MSTNNGHTVSFSDTALKHVADGLSRRGHGIGIRIGVRTSGCSGLAYTFEWLDKADESDHVEVFGDIKLAIDSKSLIYLIGTSVDYAREGLNYGFRLNNPNVQNTCGCGESFTV